MQFIFSIIGVILGSIVAELEGAAFGLAVGFLFGSYVNLKGRVSHLERAVKAIRSSLHESQPDVMADDLEEPTLAPPAHAAHYVEDTIRPPREPASIEAEIDSEIESDIDSGPPPAEEPPAGKPPGIFEQGIHYLKEFFTTGNVVVKVGVIILFFGVGFLIKYAAQKNLFPMELRLISIGIGGIIMLVLGWRLRHKRPGYALVLQGGAVGVLYLTVFAALKLNFVPPLFALTVMIAMVLLSGILAVVQDSKSLATIAAVGGFLAPVLTSTGGGSHIALFSYFALLNAGILGVAWFKAWRSLNWVGFVFTFVIGSGWGYQYYQPLYFNSVEPFLLLFFFFYVAISILFSHRQPPHLKGLVDGTLVFGVPLVAFALQSALVKQHEFGLAYSALALAAVYIVLARILWKREIEGMRLLTESFLALGVIFATLAIPLALDGRWTAAVWALEGAGMVWIGIRQQRLLVRSFGLALQIGAAIAFLTTIQRTPGAVPVLNSAYIGCLLLSLAGLFTSYYYYRHHDRLRNWEGAFHFLLLAWGLLWWFGAGTVEIERHVRSIYELKAFLFFIAASFVFLEFIAAGLAWRSGRMPGLLLLPVMAFLALVMFIDAPSKNPLAGFGFIPWIFAFGGQYLLLYCVRESWPAGLQRSWHAGSLWLLVLFTSWTFSAFLNQLVHGGGAWGDLMWGLVPAMTIFLLTRYHQRIRWPVAQLKECYFRLGLFPVVIFSMLWTLIICFNRGDPHPLPYFPVINPLELAQLFVLIVLVNWNNSSQRRLIPAVKPDVPDAMLYGVAGLAFVWLNAVVARTVHFWSGVRFDPDALHHSAVFQASISIVWTLAALTIAAIATRQGKRKLWFIGAALIAAVVFKLFFVDLKDIGTVARIISFLTVGILLMFIGYFSPLPPRPEED